MNYKFEQFNVEIVNPIVEVKTGGFDLISGITNSDILLTDSVGTKFGVNLSDLSQPSDWTPEGLLAWVMVQLEKYEV